MGNLRLGCLPRAVVAYCGIMAASVAAALLAGHAVAAWRLRGERKAWERAGQPLSEVPVRWPAREATPAALELDRRAAALAMPLIFRAGQKDAFADGALFEPVSAHFTALALRDDACGDTPAAAHRYLDAHRADLEAIAAHLTSGQEIAWRTNVDEGPREPIPSLLGHRRLGTLLLLEAMERARRGDAAGSGRMLEAAWQLGEVLARRHDVLSVLISVVFADLEGAALRCLPDPEPAWDARLQPRFREAAILSFRTDTYSWFTVTREYRGMADIDTLGPLRSDTAGRIGRTLSVPYLRFGVGGISFHTRRAQALARSSDQCRVDSDAFRKQVADGIGAWDYLAQEAVPPLSGVPTSGTAADFGSELTRLVLAQRRRLRSAGARDAAPATAPSTICGGMAWKHVRGGDGRWTIRAEPAPVFQRSKSQRWEYTLSARPR